MQKHIHIQNDKQTHLEIIIEGAIPEVLGGLALIKAGFKSQSKELGDISQSLAAYYLGGLQSK